MSSNLKAWLWRLLVAAGVGLFAWLLVWGLAVTHPEAGLPQSAAVPTMIVVFALALAYFGAKALVDKTK